MGRVLATLGAALLSMAGIATAQDGPSTGPRPPLEVAALTPPQDEELTAWLTALKSWQQYDEKWRNRPVRNGWGGIAERRPMPQAPEWLAGYCASVDAAGLRGFAERTEVACRVLDDQRSSFEAVPLPAGVSLSQEKASRTSFLSRLHFDGMWSTTSSNGRLYGIVGSHLSLVDIGRIQLFGPPGVMLLTVPDGSGGRQMALGYTWGLSIRLGDVRIGAPTKNMTVFLNVTKVFLGPTEGPAASSRGYDIVGFSIAPRKGR